MDNQKGERKRKHSPPKYRKRVAVHVTASDEVRQKIDNYAYRAGVMTHTLIENALKYAVQNNFDAREHENDPAIMNLLRPKPGDVLTTVDARVEHYIAGKIERMARRQGLEKRDYVRILLSYYIIHVLGLVKPRESTPSIEQS